MIERWVAICAWVWLAASASAQDVRQDPADVAREILSEGRFQSDLPEEGGESDELDWGGSGGGFALPLGEVAQWVLFAIGIAILVAFVIAFARSSRTPPPKAEVESSAPRAPPVVPAPAPTPFVEATLDDVRAFAAAGDFAEAIRALLGVVLGRLRDVGALAPHDWLTGREILAAAELDASAKRHLETIVRAVERSLFAGIAPAEADLATCREAYRALVAEERTA